MRRAKHLNFFDRYLSVWVLLCMMLGIAFGNYASGIISKLAELEVAQVNLPVGLLIWVMIIPMLMRIDLSELHHVKQYWRGTLVTLLINWFVKPFSMALLAWFFLRYLFASWLPTDEIDQFIAGLIILAAAPCTAMVFVWSYLCDGEPHFTLTQVGLNDLIMVVAFAPIVGLLLGVTNLTVPWNTIMISVLVYILIPFALAQGIRLLLISQHGISGLQAVLKKLHPFALSALLCMLVLLFAFQGAQLLERPLIVLLIAVPILIQVYFNSLLAYGLCKISGEVHSVAGPAALIGASNFFELAVATAITLFGFNSGATLATVVGVLIEVPVMLSIVKIINHSKAWYAKG